MIETLESAWAPSTRKNMVVQQQLYWDFCQYYRLAPLPASFKLLCLFAQFLSRKFKSADTVAGYINGVKWLHVFRGYSTEGFDHFAVKMVCQGIARQKKHVPNQALPMTPEILAELYKLLDLDDSNDVTFWTAILFSFYIMLRKSNIVPTSKSSFDSKQQLTRGDITEAPNMLLVTIKWSKTIQTGQRQHVVPLLTVPGSPLCPVTIYKRMVSLVPGRQNDPLFSVKKGDKWGPMTYIEYQSKMRSLISSTGRSGKAYSSHSLRRGGATYLASVGVSKELIKLMGDWKSDAVDKYIHVSLESKVQVAQKIRQAILKDSE